MSDRTKEIREFFSDYDSKDIIYIYTDGACRNNQKEENVGAWAYRLENMGHSKEDFGTEINTTNNIMELKGCIEALKAIKNKNKKTIVISDSQYLVSGINEWIYNWMSGDRWKNSNGKNILNKDLWMDLLKEKIKFIDIEFIKCGGHSNNDGNNRVDKLCNFAMDDIERVIGKNI